MKKLFCLILFFTLILAACNSSSVSIGQTYHVPKKVQDVINADYKLQLINDGIKNAYIIFHSTGTVTAHFEVIDNILNIKFDSENLVNTDSKQYVYKLTPSNIEINVLVNGKTMTFDNITGL